MNTRSGSGATHFKPMLRFWAGSASSVESVDSINKSPGAWIISAIVSITSLQFMWLALTMGSKIAFINLLPATVFISLWTLWITFYYSRTPYLWILLLMPSLFLNVRLPLSLFHDLPLVNWCMGLLMIGIVCKHALTLFATRKEKLMLLLLTLVLIFNAATHLKLNSPYIYTFRMMNGLSSAYTGTDNNETWECPYEQSQFPVHCDIRHYVASEKIFTEPNFDPSYSSMLRRFFHGYLNSLIGFDGVRWWTHLGLNFLFWFFSCVCIYRISTLLKQGSQVASLSMLCCASGIGFIDMVAQPAPYLLAYAYGAFVVWATIELIYSELDKWRRLFFILLIASVIMVYDAYQLILCCMLLLFLYKKHYDALFVFLLSTLFVVVWREFSMGMVLGTPGSPSIPGYPASHLMFDVTKWFETIKSVNIAHFCHMVLRGILAYLYGNLIIGALAAWFYIFVTARSASNAYEQKIFLHALMVINGITLLSSVFIVPQNTFFSPATGMVPRMNFYSYPINMIALILISLHLLKKYAWVTPLVLFLVANINLSGFASIDVLFDYGDTALYWK